MNREIKFRVWSPNEKRMLPAFELAEYMNKNENAQESYGAFDGIPLQFTGLKDKNGREIYEGDICRLTFSQDEGGGCYSHQKGQGVVFFDDYWGVKFNCKDGTQRTAETHWGRIGTHECRKVEVIGNIYENPELVGEAKS